MEAAPTFWGITGEGWIAIATFVGAGVVALTLVGGAWKLRQDQRALAQERADRQRERDEDQRAWQEELEQKQLERQRELAQEQEGRDVRRYYIDEGLWALSRSLDALLGILHQNSAASSALLELVKSRPPGTTGAPRVENLPRLAVLDWREVAIRGVRPAKVILNFRHFTNLVWTVFAIMLVSHQIFLNEVEQVVRTYYAGDTADESLAAVLEAKCEVLREPANNFSDLPRILEDAGVRLQRLRVSSFSQAEEIAHDDVRIRELTDELKAMWETVEAEAEDDD